MGIILIPREIIFKSQYDHTPKVHPNSSYVGNCCCCCCTILCTWHIYHYQYVKLFIQNFFYKFWALVSEFHSDVYTLTIYHFSCSSNIIFLLYLLVILKVSKSWIWNGHCHNGHWHNNDGHCHNNERP